MQSSSITQLDHITIPLRLPPDHNPKSQVRIPPLRGRSTITTSPLRLHPTQDIVRCSDLRRVFAHRLRHYTVAADVDEWIVTKVKEKEDRYAASMAKKDKKIADLRARNDELERIYALCGKELMLAWGREEFGKAQSGEKQKYRYRHAVQGLA